MSPPETKPAKTINPVAAFLILAAASAGLGVSGVAVLFGAGWALIAASLSLALGAGLIWKGLKNSG